MSVPGQGEHYTQPMPFTYRLWDHILASDFDFGELESASNCNSGNSILINRAPDADWPEPESQPIFEDRFPNGDIWLTSWKLGDSYLFRFPGLCSVRIRPAEMRIDCAPQPNVSEPTIAHLILDLIVPPLLSLEAGSIVLHASAIHIEDKIIAVLGPSGRGKSTLAAWFASQGFPLLTDDCLVLRWDERAGQWLAQPSYQSVRLWPDSVRALGIPDSELREFAGYSEKKRTGREVDFRFATGGAPLSACFVLPDPLNAGESRTPHSGPPKIRPLPVNEAFLALVGSVFRIDPSDPLINRREFEVLTSLTESVRFWSLEYERKYSWLPAVQAAMIKAIQDSASKDQH